jgi:hypothetical protein
MDQEQRAHRISDGSETAARGAGMMGHAAEHADLNALDVSVDRLIPLWNQVTFLCSALDP